MSDPSPPTSRRGRGASGSRADGLSRSSGISTRSRRQASPGRVDPEEEKSNALSTEVNAISIGGQDPDAAEDQDQDYDPPQDEQDRLSEGTIYHGLDFYDNDDNDDNDDDDDDDDNPTATTHSFISKIFVSPKSEKPKRGMNDRRRRRCRRCRRHQHVERCAKENGFAGLSQL